MLFNSEIFSITLLSLQVSAIATILSLLIGLPLGTWLALGNFRARSFLLSIINTGMALPPLWLGWSLRSCSGAVVRLADCA